MRITTQMLNESARKAGLPLDNHTLLDYINTGTSAPSVLDDEKSILETTRNALYGKESRRLWQAAEGLDTQAKKLCAGGEENIFAKAKDGDASGICREAEKLAENYNSVLDVLSKSPDGLNAFYLKSLKSLADKNKSELESVGITLEKDGRLSVDKDKLAAAGLEKLKNVFGEEGSFAPGVSFISSRIADNARAEAESILSMYGSNGMQKDAGTYGKYDLWG